MNWINHIYIISDDQSFSLDFLDKDFAKKIKSPTLIVHGSADPIIRVEGSYEIFKYLSSKSKELFIAPSCYHELHNELVEDREHYFQHLGMWLNTQIKAKRSS